MKVLVIGSGGREHSLVWKIGQSPRVEKLYCAPGNAGIGEMAELVAIGPEEIERLADFAEKESIDLTVVGPELPKGGKWVGSLFLVILGVNLKHGKPIRHTAERWVHKLKNTAKVQDRPEGDKISQEYWGKQF